MKWEGKNGFKMKNKNQSNFLNGVTQVHYKSNKITYFDKFGNIKILILKNENNKINNIDNY